MNKDNQNLNKSRGVDKNLALVRLPLPHSSIFKQLLDQIEPLDFNKVAGLKPKENPTNTDLRIIVVEFIKDKSKKNNWGICQYNEQVYLYNGAFWKPIEPAEMKNFLGNVSSKLGLGWKKYKDYKFKDELFKQFISAGFQKLNNDIDDKTIKINLRNGTFNIGESVNELKGFDALDFIRYQLPFPYDPQATCPLFTNFLNEVLPDIESQQVLSEFVASTFIKPSRLKLEKALILFGSGANGKSVFFEVIMALLGKENVSNYSLSSLTNENGYARAELANKLLNYVSELHGKMKSDVFKQLSSGEPIEARSPYGRPYIVSDYAKFIFNCNQLPTDIEQTEGFFRRFIIVPFMKTIPESMQDKELSKKIISSELSGIFNWVQLGLQRVLSKKDYSNCLASEIKVMEYKKSSNSVLLFLEDSGYISSVKNEIKLKDIYLEYITFCSQNGYRSISGNSFSDNLRSSGFEVARVSAGRVVYVEKKDTDVSTLLTFMA